MSMPQTPISNLKLISTRVKVTQFPLWQRKKSRKSIFSDKQKLFHFNIRETNETETYDIFARD